MYVYYAHSIRVYIDLVHPSSKIIRILIIKYCDKPPEGVFHFFFFQIKIQSLLKGFPRKLSTFDDPPGKVPDVISEYL